MSNSGSVSANPRHSSAMYYVSHPTPMDTVAVVEESNSSRGHTYSGPRSEKSSPRSPKGTTSPSRSRYRSSTNKYPRSSNSSRYTRKSEPSAPESVDRLVKSSLPSNTSNRVTKSISRNIESSSGNVHVVVAKSAYGDLEVSVLGVENAPSGNLVTSENKSTSGRVVNIYPSPPRVENEVGRGPGNDKRREKSPSLVLPTPNNTGNRDNNTNTRPPIARDKVPRVAEYLPAIAKYSSRPCVSSTSVRIWSCKSERVE